MGHTVVGVFRHSGDADMAAAHLQLEYVLTASELDVIGAAEWERLTPPAVDTVENWIVSSLTGVGLQEALGDANPVGKRWGDKVWQGETLVVARANDPDIAHAIAKDMQETGAERVDVLPH